MFSERHYSGPRRQAIPYMVGGRGEIRRLKPA